MRYLALASLVILTAFLVVGAAAIHEYGEPNCPLMDAYFIRFAQQDTGANNAVTSIVFDYRGYDTLGEATILFTAVTGVAMLFARRLSL